MLTFNVTGDRITGTYGSKNFSIAFDTEAINVLEEYSAELDEATSMAEVEEIYAELDEWLNPTFEQHITSKRGDLFFDNGEYYLVHNSQILMVPIPKVLVLYMKEAEDKNLSTDPIIKFWIRLLRNPNIRKDSKEEVNQFVNDVCIYISQTFVDPVLKQRFLEEEGLSEEKAIEFATVRQTPITKEGLICTKKVVTPLYNKFSLTRELVESGEPITFGKYNEDWVFEPVVMGKGGDAFYCGSSLGHELIVGQEVYHTSWDKINCNRNASCVKGLHTGNQDYINGWENDNNVTLNMLVCPSQIGAIPVTSWCGGFEAGMMRVKSYFPVSIKNREDSNRNLYHSSTYAAKKDEEWEEEKNALLLEYADMVKNIDDWAEFVVSI